jgi:hypothetical protein
MTVPDLQILDGKSRKLGPAQSAAHEHRKHCEITGTAQIISAGFLQQKPSLIMGQPVSRPGPRLFSSFDPANACSEFRTEQAGICSLNCSIANLKFLLE